MKTLAFAFFAFLTAFMSFMAPATAAVACKPWVDYSNDAELSQSEILHYNIAIKLRDLYKGERFLLKTEQEKAEHKKEMIQNISASMALLGYAHVSVEEVLTCSNEGSKLDYNLLRYALATALKQYYIF